MLLHKGTLVINNLCLPAPPTGCWESTCSSWPNPSDHWNLRGRRGRRWLRRTCRTETSNYWSTSSGPTTSRSEGSRASEQWGKTIFFGWWKTLTRCSRLSVLFLTSVNLGCPPKVLCRAATGSSTRYQTQERGSLIIFDPDVNFWVDPQRSVLLSPTPVCLYLAGAGAALCWGLLPALCVPDLHCRRAQSLLERGAAASLQVTVALCCFKYLPACSREPRCNTTHWKHCTFKYTYSCVLLFCTKQKWQCWWSPILSASQFSFLKISLWEWIPQISWSY